MNAVARVVSVCAVAWFLVSVLGGAEEAARENVSARMFTLVDGNGKAVGYFTTNKDGNPVIALGKGQNDVYITVDDDGGSLRAKSGDTVSVVSSGKAGAMFASFNGTNKVWGSTWNP